MPMPTEELEALLRQSFPDAEIMIDALADDQDHYHATIISKAFAGKNRVAQHQLVYKALRGKMGDALHALQLTTRVP